MIGPGSSRGQDSSVSCRCSSGANCCTCVAGLCWLLSSDWSRWQHYTGLLISLSTDNVSIIALTDHYMYSCTPPSHPPSPPSGTSTISSYHYSRLRAIDSILLDLLSILQNLKTVCCTPTVGWPIHHEKSIICFRCTLCYLSIWTHNSKQHI